MGSLLDGRFFMSYLEKGLIYRVPEGKRLLRSGKAVLKMEV